MEQDVRLMAAARAIDDACFTLAPISFDEAARKGTLHYERAMKAADEALQANSKAQLRVK